METRFGLTLGDDLDTVWPIEELGASESWQSRKSLSVQGIRGRILLMIGGAAPSLARTCLRIFWTPSSSPREHPKHIDRRLHSRAAAAATQ